MGVNDWLLNQSRQKIRFKDRYEYKLDGKYHRLDGPAIQYIDINGKGDENDIRNIYYIDGESMNKDKWEPKAQNLLREIKLERVLKKQKQK